MKIKKGVSIAGVQPAMVLGMLVINSVYIKWNVEYVLTSIMEGKHKSYSLHYVGFAQDSRTREFIKADLSAVAEDLRESLGDEFEVIFEGDHFHIEFQPQRGTNL